MATLDKELVEGFYREAREYLPQAAECLALLAGDGTREPAIVELHRLAHNLRSVTSAVGLNEASEVAQGAEELAEAIATGAMPFDAEALELFQDALRQLEGYIGEASASRQAVAAPKPTPVQAPALQIPRDLIEGFLDEGRELLDRAWKQMRVARNNPTGRPGALLEVRRAVHTLKGSAGMVGMRDLSALAHVMEDVLDAVHDENRLFTTEIGDLFSRTLDTIADTIANGGTMPTVAAEDLHAEYAALARGAAPSHPQPAAAATAAPAAPVPESTPAAETPSVRVGLDRLDASLELVGEFSIIRSGWDSQLAGQRRQLDELALTIRRCQRIAQRLETEYAIHAPGAHQGWGMGGHTHESGRVEFDALEFDRYTDFHLLSRDLSETASDLVTIEAQLSTLASEFDGTRGRYAKFTAELQDQILQMRMAPVSTIASRLDRTVRTTARTLEKDVELFIEGSGTLLDKATLDALAAPLEHILRNAVSHGIEGSAVRRAAGKPAQGRITVQVAREGSTAVVQVRDDGEGIHADRVRSAAIRKGLITATQAASLDGSALFDLLLEPGFSTATRVSEISGRGVGLDIVRSTVESLKGTISIESTPGEGTLFLLRVPLSQAILRVLFVEAANQAFALPLSNVLRAGPDAAGGSLRRIAIEEVLRLPVTGTPRPARPAVVLDCGSAQIALLVDRVMDIREILVKPPVGILRQSAAVSGTTTLADGTVVLVLRPPQLLRAQRRAGDSQPETPAIHPSKTSRGPLEILVIDDSVSVRRVVSNTLRKYGWNVTAAKDGLEGLEAVNEMPRHPDAILVDVEMPRMDGYDFTLALRADPATNGIPVIMLTSRGGDKHREKAFDVGVTDFLVKPYAEDQLVSTIRRYAVST